MTWRCPSIESQDEYNAQEVSIQMTSRQAKSLFSPSVSLMWKRSSSRDVCKWCSVTLELSKLILVAKRAENCELLPLACAKFVNDGDTVLQRSVSVRATTTYPGNHQTPTKISEISSVRRYLTGRSVRRRRWEHACGRQTWSNIEARSKASSRHVAVRVTQRLRWCVWNQHARWSDWKVPCVVTNENMSDTFSMSKADAVLCEQHTAPRTFCTHNIFSRVARDWIPDSVLKRIVFP